MDLKGLPTALLVIDMQNAFCHPNGSLARLGHDIAMCQEAIEGCGHLVTAARKAAIPAIFTRYAYRDDYRDGGILVEELNPALKKTGALVHGSWDAEIVDQLPVQDRDFVVTKNRYSAFYGTNLETILTSLGIRNLVICGVTTNMCVETTARDGMQRDYRVFVVSDATGELDRERHVMALRTLNFGFAWVVTINDVIQAIVRGSGA